MTTETDQATTASHAGAADAVPADAPIRMLLAAARLPAGEHELPGLAADYGLHRAAVEALYEVPEARYVDPALRFRAGARISPWA